MNLPFQPKWILISVLVVGLVNVVLNKFPFALCPFIFRSGCLLLVLSLPVGIFTGVRKLQRWYFLFPAFVILGLAGIYGSILVECGNEFMDRAARRGITPWLVQLLDSDHHGPDVVDTHGNSLLMKAAENGQTDTVKELLRRGARTDYRDGDGDTALSVAESHHHTEIIELLKKAGARR